MSAVYAPLRAAAGLEAPGRMAGRMVEGVNEKTGGLFGGWTGDRYLQAFARFLSTEYDKDDRDVQAVLSLYKMTGPSILQAMGVREKHLKDGAINPRTEWADVFLISPLIDEWAKNKQCFHPDRDFADALLSTEKLSYRPETFERLPCSCFYLDLEECTAFPDAYGVIVHIDTASLRTDGAAFVSMVMLGAPRAEKDKLTMYSSYIGIRFQDGEEFTLGPAWFKEADDAVRRMSESLDGIPGLAPNDSGGAPYLMALQMIAYLSLEDPQVEESRDTRDTYRPRPEGTPVKNKFREVRIRDVGVRYGKEFRRKKQAAATSLQKEKETPGTALPSRSVKPHFRCAHWHWHCVGKGRKERKLMWHEPVFVAGTGAAGGGDAVIHRIKKEKA